MMWNDRWVKFRPLKGVFIKLQRYSTTEQSALKRTSHHTLQKKKWFINNDLKLVRRNEEEVIQLLNKLDNKYDVTTHDKHK